MEERRYNIWIVVRPAEDLPGQWVAHCLDFDVMSQGDSPSHAVKMAHEAVRIVVLDELNKGRDPLERRAPEEFFGELYGLFDRGQKMSDEEVKLASAQNRLRLLAMQFELRFHRILEEEEDGRAPLSMRPTHLSIGQQASC